MCVCECVCAKKCLECIDYQLECIKTHLLDVTVAGGLVFFIHLLSALCK